MKVSILIPTKDRLALLKEALASAQAQTHADLEIVVSDDGSSDGTQAWLREAAAADPRIVIPPRNPQPGLFENINHLLDHKRGDAFGVLADDDRLLPTFVQRLLEPLQHAADVAATFCDCWQISTLGERLEHETLNESTGTGRAKLPPGVVIETAPAVIRNMMVVGLTVYRSNLLERERFDLDCGGAADIDFGLRLIAKGKVVYVSERLGEIRMHPHRASAVRLKYMTRGRIRALEKYRSEVPTWERLRLQILQATRVSYAIQLRQTDRAECLQVIADYMADSRSFVLPVHVPSLLASLAVACLPRPLGTSMISAARSLRRRL